ncbi:hypothetical protein AMEX_G8177 [Astyanax mexicanus]|uniref:C2H2-type domain-containing protein n=1 Tax=Astyanax mexicanus TaxID=7994 RepID=A0A8T2LVH2_ASTMX|nr:hypothetical protein AMEX_G8177 [Astyanax mexicanus]
MELVEQSVSGLFLAEGAVVPLALHHEAPPETSLDHSAHGDVRESTMTVQITSLEGQKLEFPIPLERIIEPISPAEVPLEESELLVSHNETLIEESAGCDDPEDHHVQSASDIRYMPSEIMAATDLVLVSNPTEPCTRFELQSEHTEEQVDSTVSTALYPDALLDPGAQAEEPTCENGISEGSPSNSSSLSDAGKCKEVKSIRKRIPPKKDRMDPLKMDMSKPTVIPLTSSQLSLQCLECHIIFSDDKSKQRHLKMNHPTEYEQFILGDSYFACYVCDRHFTCSTELMAHQRTHTEKQPFKCPVCGEAFSRSSELTTHKKVHLNKHGYDCPDCGKICKTLTLLKYHQRIHTGERPYVCLHKGCGKRFSMPKAAQKHQEAHDRGEAVGTKKKSKCTSAKNYACSQCEQSFRTAKSQLLHIQTKHMQNKSITFSSSSVAGQELNGNPHDTTQPAALQPPVLRMEAIGPAPQIGPLGAEQIKRLIEKLGNVQKVNQLVILGVDQIQNAPLHFNFTEPAAAQSVEEQETRDQTEEQPVHEETVSVTADQTTCKESLVVGVTVEQEETMVQEERANSESLLSLNPEIQVAAAESDMAVAQLSEVQLQFIPQLTEQSDITLPQLEVYHENTQITEEQIIEVASDVNTVESRDLSSLIPANNCENGQYQKIEEEHVTMSTDIMSAEEIITHEESLEKHKADEMLVETETHTIDDCQDLKEQPEQLSQNDSDLKKQSEQLSQKDPDLKEQSEQLSYIDQDLREQSEEISQKDPDLKKQSEQICQKDSDLKEQSEQMCQKDKDTKQTKQLFQEDQNLSEQSEELSQKDENLREQSEKLSQKDKDLNEQPEQLSQKETTFSESEMTHPSIDSVHHDQEISYLDQDSGNTEDTQSSKVVVGEPNLANVGNGLPKKKLLPKKKKITKKQVSKKPQKEVAKITSQATPKKKAKKPSKTVPKKTQKAKSKKLSNLQTTEKNQVPSGPKENLKEKSPKQQIVQISKTSKIPNLLKDQQDENADQVQTSSQNDSSSQMKQKNQKQKKGKTGENSSDLLKSVNVPNDPKEPSVPEQTPRGKFQKKKTEKQKDLVKKRKSQETHQDETPTPKKKKQSKTPESVSPKKVKVKNGTVKKPKLSKQAEKEQKNSSPTSSPEQIKQQALLLLKGHKQPQLKVHKLDAKTTGLEQPPKPKSQTKEASEQEAKVVKAKGGKQNKVLQTANQNKKKAKTLGKESKKKKKDDPHFSLAPVDGVTDSELLQTKPKVPRKRKAPTKIDQEIALSPPFSRLTIGCHDCGTKFSEVSALQEHMASMHSENGLLQSSVGCDDSENLMMSPRSNELVLTNSHDNHPHDFEIQVASDWEMETEMRGIGLGDVDVHRLSFPALSSSPSLPVASTFAEGEGKVQDRGDQDAHSKNLETIGEESTESSQAFTQQVSSTSSDHIQTNGKESLSQSLISDPQESMDIKEELPSDVNLVMVEDQSEEDVPTQVNDSSLLVDCPEDSTGQQKEDESSHNPQIHTATSPQIKLPAQQENSTSQHTDTQTVIKHEEEEMLVQEAENQSKPSMARNRKGRGGRGRGKKQLGKRSAAENDGTKELEADKEECQVVFQMYSLSDDCEEKNEGTDRQKRVKSVGTVHSRSALEKSSENQAVSDAQPDTTGVTEETQAEDSSLIQKSGQQDRNGTSSAAVIHKILAAQERKGGRTRRQDIEGHTSTGTSMDVKKEAAAPVPASHDVHPNERDLLRGVQVFLVKSEDHEPNVLQGIQDMETTGKSGGIPSGSSTVSQSAGKQCIFYPVKEEEREILVEPALDKPGVPEERTRRSGSWASSALQECEEVQMGCTQMELHHTVYSSVEEDEVGTEQQSSKGFLEFLSQSSDSEDTDNFQSDPEAETHVMSCYNGICINRGVQQHETSRNRSSHAEHQERGRNTSWKPIDYFIQYFSWDTWKEIAECTGKASKLPEPVTEKEVAQFVGIHIAMGTLKFPSMKLYWEDCTRVPLIADAMSSSRFSELSSNLRLTPPTEDSSQKSPNQLGTSVETPAAAAGERSKMSSQICGNQVELQNCRKITNSKTDPLWKVQVLVNRVREGCRALKRQGNHGVDQYPLPFQRHPTHSLHHTVMVNVAGLVMDLNLRINDSNREEVVGKMVIRENDDDQGMIFLCKPELSTPSMLEHLLEAGVRSAGKVGGSRGHVGDEFVTSDGKLKLFRCHHGFILSAVMKEKSRSTSLVSGFERAIKAVNLNRDLRSLYRTPCTSALPGAWPMSVLWDLIDLALVNSWLQYKEEHRHVSESLSLMDFRLEVSKALILPSSTAQESSAPQPPAPERPSSNSYAGPSDDFDTPLPDAATRYDGVGHWPEQLAEGEEARCRFGGCERTSRVRCLKCCVFLCISRNHNCFLKFHSQGAA